MRYDGSGGAAGEEGAGTSVNDDNKFTRSWYQKKRNEAVERSTSQFWGSGMSYRPSWTHARMPNKS